MKVLVTGSSGLIGSVLINTLSDTLEFSGLDARKPDKAKHVPTLITSGSDLDAIMVAFDGVDAVIHLAASVRVGTLWPDVLKNNISMTHNVSPH